MKHLVGFGVLSALMMTLGCSPYISDFHYAPRPAVLDVPAVQPQEASGAAYASVIGVRRDQPKEGIPESIEVRLRIENDGPGHLVFDPQSLELLDGMLLKYPPPIARPPRVVDLATRESAVISAFVPFPPGRSYRNTDLDHIQLRWTLKADDRLLPQGASFHRVFPVYYGPYGYYPPPPVWFGGGVVVVRHHR